MVHDVLWTFRIAESCLHVARVHSAVAITAKHVINFSLFVGEHNHSTVDSAYDLILIAIQEDGDQDNFMVVSSGRGLDFIAASASPVDNHSGDTIADAVWIKFVLYQH